MSPYSPDVERTMRAFYHSLRENDRRRYAAVEAAKLGHGGVEYIAKVLGVDPKTIRHGQRDLEDLPAEPAPQVRQPGGGGDGGSIKTPRSPTTSTRSSSIAPPAAQPRSP